MDERSCGVSPTDPSRLPRTTHHPPSSHIHPPPHHTTPPTILILTSTPKQKHTHPNSRLLAAAAVACAYVVGHAVLLFMHVVTLFVAVNSSDQVRIYVC